MDQPTKDSLKNAVWFIVTVIAIVFIKRFLHLSSSSVVIPLGLTFVGFFVKSGFVIIEKVILEQKKSN